MNLTEEQVGSIVPRCKQETEITEALNHFLPSYEIDTKERVAAFFSQCAVESEEFTVFMENLNYSAKALTLTWPKRFPSIEKANQYARNPEKIANYVYANRMGNGGEQSGDGWKFRGRGVIQVTGHDNYEDFAQHVGMSIDDVVDYMETIEGAIESACYYWQSNNINEPADAGDIEEVTRRVNKGLLALDKRKYYYQLALDIL